MNYKVAKTMLLIMGKSIRHFSMDTNVHIAMRDGKPNFITTRGTWIPLVNMDGHYKPTINSNAHFSEGWELYEPEPSTDSTSPGFEDS